MKFPNEQAIAKVIYANPAKQMIADAQKKRKLRSIHVTGKNLKDAIVKMDYFEDDDRRNIRQTYTRSNRDLFARILRPLDKVFSAKGGSVATGLTNKGKAEAKLQEALDNVADGVPVREWVQKVAMQAYLIDPMGLVLIETDEDGEVEPCYLSVDKIYDIKFDGRQPEYIICELTGDDKNELVSRKVITEEAAKEGTNRYFRVIDDAGDYTVLYTNDNNQPTVRTLETFPSKYDEIPAIAVSNIQEFDTKVFISPIDDIVELANEYLTDCSIKSIFKKLHGFPKAWRYASLCVTCAGTRFVGGKECPSCKGTGKQLRATVKDELLVPIPAQGDPVMDVFGGFTVPPIETWTKMTDELLLLEKFMTYTMWGSDTEGGAVKSGTTNSQSGANPKTATQAFMDVGPVNDRLKQFSEWAEALEKFITDAVGKVVIGAAFKGATVSYGDRYMLEKPDDIWKKYETARTSGAPTSTLDGLLKDYIEARYQGAGMDYQIAMNLMLVEPWIHSTAAELMPLGLASEDYHQKLYFPEWLKLQSPLDLADPTKVDVMRKSLAEFSAQKTAKVQADNQSKVKDQIAVAQARGIMGKQEPNDTGDGEGTNDQGDPGEGGENNTGQ